MTTQIYLPRGYQEFKRQIAQAEREARPAFSLKWNDLSPEGKTKLAVSIKHYSHSRTLRNSPRAPIENIILALNTTNPVLDSTPRNTNTIRQRWIFVGSCLSTRNWLDRISSLLITTLQLRKQNENRFINFYSAIEGWPYYRVARQIADTELNFERNILNTDTQINIPEEISLQEVSHARTLTGIRNNN